MRRAFALQALALSASVFLWGCTGQETLEAANSDNASQTASKQITQAKNRRQ